MDEKELGKAVRASLKKTHEIHVGVQHGSIASYVAGNGSLSNLARLLNHVNL